MNWYLHRLASMSAEEILWRARTAARLPFDWAEAHSNLAVPPASAAKGQQRYPICANARGEPNFATQIFDLAFPLGHRFDWHCDYRHQINVPRRFSPLLDIHNREADGDIKYIWEINRHQFLSALAYAANRTRTVPYIVSCIDSWIQENPYLEGVNWTSSLELALRLISWSLAYPVIRGTLDRDLRLRNRFAACIYRHLHSISRNLSRFSSANNHLIGEASGLYVGALCFPWWAQCAFWKRQAKAILETEILCQVSEDGVNREQATSYHLFTLELFLLAWLVARNSGEVFSEAFAGRVRAMLDYLNAISTPAGDLPWFGDSDDARGFLFSLSPNNLRTVMELGGLLFGEPALLRFSTGAPTVASQALLPERAPGIREVRRGAGRANTRCLFERGGIGILTDGRDAKLILDFGEHGYTSIAAHAHADALSVQLALGDEYFLIDPGTYAYHSHPEWRTYFRSTAAHNTVRIDGVDQSVMGGSFLWTFKAQSRLLSYSDRDDAAEITAEHDGYRRLPDPVIHRRHVILDKRQSQVTIVDSFDCQDRHAAELLFHFHPATTVLATSTNLVELAWKGRYIRVGSPDPNLRYEVFRGVENPILGWRSPQFNRKEPIYTLRISATLDGSQTITTNLTFG
jgi:hypothetical protein